MAEPVTEVVEVGVDVARPPSGERDQPELRLHTAEEVLEQLRGTTKVARPSTINPNVPAALDKVVMKMLARRQENRYQTPGDLLAEVDAIAEELGVEV